VICNNEDTDGRARVTTGFYLKTEQRSDCVGSPVGWLWELCTWLRGVYIQCVRWSWASAELWG